MCMSIRQLDSKTRRIYAAFNVSVCSAIMLNLFFEQSLGHRHHAVFNGLRYLLTGCAMGLFFWFLRRRHSACAPRP